MKNKVLAIMMVMLLVLGMSSAALAAGAAPDYVVKKNYTGNGMNPAETFEFAIVATTITDLTDVSGDVPMPDVTDAVYAADEAVAAGSLKGIVTLPTYSAVGVYTYLVTETASNTAGVVYDTKTVLLVVYVTNEIVEGAATGNLVAQAIAVDYNDGEFDLASKGINFENTYTAYDFAVTKKVTGNLGDLDKYFDVTVTFEAAANEVINSAITYIGGQYTTAQAVTGNTATIQVKDGDTVTFSNVPAGVTYTVAEADYTGEGYAAANYADAASGTLEEDTTVTITNNKTTEIQTGVSLDDMPYVLLMGVAILGIVALVLKKRAAGNN